MMRGRQIVPVLELGVRPERWLDLAGATGLHGALSQTALFGI